MTKILAGIEDDDDATTGVPGEVFTLPHVFLEDSWQSYQEYQESSRNCASAKWLENPFKFLLDSWRIPGGFLVEIGNS